MPIKYRITVQDLLQEKRKIKNLFFKQNLMSIRLVMEGHSIWIFLQSTSMYMQTFNSDGIESLLERRHQFKRILYLSFSEETESNPYK